MDSLNKFKVGDKVRLSTGCPYKPCKENPVIGTKFECVGTIKQILGKVGHVIMVSWNNGTFNSYIKEELFKVDETRGHKLTKIFK